METVIWNVILYWLAWMGFCFVVYQLLRFSFHFYMLFDRSNRFEEQIKEMQKTIRELESSVNKVSAEQSGINAAFKVIKNIQGTK